jgi:transposase-like protein
MLSSYETPSAMELNKALDAIKQLADDDEISEILAKQLIKLLVSRHIHDELSNNVRMANPQSSPKSLKFMNFKYGRTHETYA